MRIAHVGIHKSENRNAGDTLLFAETRRVIEALAGRPVSWRLIDLWAPVTARLVDELNASADLIVIGGGGIFLRDQQGADASRSGWQWNCGIEMLDRIDVPIALFGVGYNRFRGQEDFDPVFTEHLNLLAGKAVMLGLRNNGSIRNLERYLAPAHHVKLRLQPCPTTLLARTRDIPAASPAPPIATFNLAYDRPQFRFGAREAEVLGAISRTMGLARAAGCQVEVCLHKTIDREIAARLPDRDFRVVDISGASPDDIVAYYAGVAIAAGMRGHGQLIPFGANKRIVSIVSHDKLQYFLDDIGHPDWGADVRSPSFSDDLARVFSAVWHGPGVPAQLRAAQDRLWDLTAANVALMTGAR